MAALVLTGVLMPGAALKGLGDTTVVMSAALFAIGEGVSRTGVTPQFTAAVVSCSSSDGFFPCSYISLSKCWPAFFG